MSRRARHLTKDVRLSTGVDVAVGKFIQLTDDRYMKSGKDEQGEGYVLDWDMAFGFSLNLIGATEEDLENDLKMVELCDKFINSLKPTI